MIIHLIHLRRRRSVQWAAMIFLLAAQKLNKGFSKLRQWLILAFRVLAVAALVFLVSRPLAGGLLGLTGGAPDTVIVLLDRSASMEQENLETGLGKREAGLAKITEALKATVGNRSRLVLIDSAVVEPVEIEGVDQLPEHPYSAATGTAADVPELLQAGLDYITTNQTGRTDVWVLSDLRRSDWDAGGGRWEALRGGFASLPGVRFHLLTYGEPTRGNMGISVEGVERRETADGAELSMDLRLTRSARGEGAETVPIRFVVDGLGSTHEVEFRDTQLVLQGHRLPIDKATKRGWGRVEIPGDGYAMDDVFHFVYDEAPVLRAAVVSDSPDEASPLRALLSAAADGSRRYEVDVIPPEGAAEIVWDETALIVWQAPIPGEGDILRQQLENQVAAGRVVIFLPPEGPGGEAFMGLSWGEWVEGDEGAAVEWWRSDAGLLANTQDGSALPVGELQVLRSRGVEGEGAPLARSERGERLLVRAVSDAAGGAYFLATLPGPGSSSLARDGVVLYAMMHRALKDGARGLGKARQRWASRSALGGEEEWEAIDGREGALPSALAVSPGVVRGGDLSVALNRPPGEDRLDVMGRPALEELFEGLDYQVIEESIEDTGSLASEIWRTFLILMGAALLGEALLCMPARRERPVEEEVEGGQAT
ncbi:MAG: BatA domain-containing protein [Verrucomicrobiota bacterium]